MPLYEFKCRACDHNWEARVEWKAPYPACPECESAEVKKVYHPVGLVFKGSGWHVNDYGKNGAKASITGNGKKAESSDSSSSSTSTTTESKPSETKADSTSPSTPAATPAAAKD